MEVLIVLLLAILGAGLIVAGVAVIGGLGPALIAGGILSMLSAALLSRGVHG